MSMAERRLNCGRCSFIVPGRFELQEGAGLHAVEAATGQEVPADFVCITLLDASAQEGAPDTFQGPEEMDPDAYPTSINLTTVSSKRHPDPKDYLRMADDELRKHLPDYKVDFSRHENVGDAKAAVSQTSFAANFRIFRLNIAWVIGGELAVAAMMVSENGVTQGWQDLRAFCESVRLQN
jgi:hypothetical protein